MQLQTKTLMLAATSVGVLLGGLALFAVAQEQPASDRDVKELLEGLDESKPNASPRKQTPAGEDLGTPSAADPLAGIAARMRDASRRLAAKDTSQATLELQAGIARNLEELIKQLESQAAQRRTVQRAATRPSNQAGNASETSATAKKTTSQAATREDLIDAVWGRLPQRLRQQIRNPAQEEFLPSYQQLIEDYYKRLAEEQQRLRD